MNFLFIFYMDLFWGWQASTEASTSFLTYFLLVYPYFRKIPKIINQNSPQKCLHKPRKVLIPFCFEQGPPGHRQVCGGASRYESLFHKILKNLNGMCYCLGSRSLLFQAPRQNVQRPNLGPAHSYY